MHRTVEILESSLKRFLSTSSAALHAHSASTSTTHASASEAARGFLFPWSFPHPLAWLDVPVLGDSPAVFSLGDSPSLVLPEPAT